ncbi:MAG: DUF4252 domain-containing protein [Steroidobacteraceae bacterium]|jgi:hypothetical protein
MRIFRSSILGALLMPALAFAAASPQLVLPDFTALSQKATQSTTITLDSTLLSLAGRFLDGDDPQDAAAKDVIKGIKGIYVRSFTFDTDSAYSQSDFEAVRRQLTAPAWSRLVQTRSKKTHADVDIYVMIVDKQAVGLALISSEPRALTIVNIVGSIDLEKLHKLEGQFGVPKLDLEPQK